MQDDISIPDDFVADRQVAQLRIPPHSIEGESSVIGGLLLSNEAWDRVVYCGEGAGDALSEGSYILGECDSWEGLG